MDQFDSGGTASYNGLLLSTKTRLGSNVNIDANYTWSHCIGDVTQACHGRRRTGRSCSIRTTGASIAATARRRRSAGTQGLDRRQIFNFTAVAQAPKFTNKALGTVVTGLAVGGQLARDFRAASLPQPRLDQQLSGTGGQRPNQILPNPLCANPECLLAGSTRARSRRRLSARWAISGRSSIPGPGFWEIDLALVRSFRIREGEAFRTAGRSV